MRFTIALAALSTGATGTGGYVGWSVFAYTYMANAFFLVSLCVMLSCPVSELTSVASFSQIRPPAGHGFGFSGVDADHRPLYQEQENPIPLRLLICHPASFHVVAEQSVIPTLDTVQKCNHD